MARDFSKQIETELAHIPTKDDKNFIKVAKVDDGSGNISYDIRNMWTDKDGQTQFGKGIRIKTDDSIAKDVVLAVLKDMVTDEDDRKTIEDVLSIY